MKSIQSNTEYNNNTTTIQMGFRRKSNDLFESVSQVELFELMPYDQFNNFSVMSGYFPGWQPVHFNPCPLSPDISSLKKSEDPDQLASNKAI